MHSQTGVSRTRLWLASGWGCRVGVFPEGEEIRHRSEQATGHYRRGSKKSGSLYRNRYNGDNPMTSEFRNPLKIWRALGDDFRTLAAVAPSNQVLCSQAPSGARVTLT